MGYQNEVYLKLISSGAHSCCVCDCGEVFDNATVHYTTDKNGVREFNYFSPERCLSCECTIKGILIVKEVEE